MKLLYILTVIFFATTTVFAQETEVLTKKEQRKLAREKRQAEQEAQALKQQQLVEYMIETRRFVLEADYIGGKSGRRYVVNSNINFIIVDSTEATIQIGNNSGSGYNGVGGITVDGRITKFDVSERENKRGKSYNITLYVLSSVGQYDINFWIQQNGNADASIRGNFSGSVSYTGKIIHPANSRVYKGFSFP
jgi:hypothetical protein